MFARQGQAQWRKQLVKHTGLAARHDGQRAVQQLLQVGQQSYQHSRHLDSIRGLGKRHQRAVEVEKKGCPGGDGRNDWHGLRKDSCAALRQPSAKTAKRHQSCRSMQCLCYAFTGKGSMRQRTTVACCTSLGTKAG